MTELATKTCLPCTGATPRLLPEEVDALMPQVPEWRVSDDGASIVRRMTPKGFKRPLAVVAAVAEVAEAEGHHPDVAFGWGYVHLTLTTHAIDGLSEADLIVAAKFDAAIAAFG